MGRESAKKILKFFVSSIMGSPDKIENKSKEQTESRMMTIVLMGMHIWLSSQSPMRGHVVAGDCIKIIETWSEIACFVRLKLLFHARRRTQELIAAMWIK